jgi:hypothetical protein
VERKEFAELTIRAVGVCARALDNQKSVRVAMQKEYLVFIPAYISCL